ncbi:hypothetical protein RB623_03225 [Mesorhizobium sp. LHD-90]|uniref:hypothetical protein n=1 Tax=Mesorhizobium sp. LHD-90 TaxID=3071414 RepID=UPI0027DF76DE|nr:hypothetical protein [Mesorhizobium sp. LHD-90]MDQ6433062.1 hypothetical protein [Mesorhizobium sp. LHD-90]
MDGSGAIEKNLQALKRILAWLVSMAGFADGAPTLPRQLHRAILRLLRPAESAARRLIIAAARGIVVTLPPFRPRKPKPAVRRGPRAFMPVGPKKRPKPALRTLSLPLLDPLKNPFRVRRRYVPAHAVPRILSFDAPYRPLPPPPSLDDPVNASRLVLRLEALGRALDDLPGQANRFARWKARNDAARARDREARAAGVQNQQRREAVRFRRVSPLRRGRPPGGRLSRYDPTAIHPRNIREIDEILAHAHALAVYALDSPNTS